MSVASLQIVPNRVRGGQTVECTLTLNHSALTPTSVVISTPSYPVATYLTITIPAGSATLSTVFSAPQFTELLPANNAMLLFQHRLLERLQALSPVF